MFTPCWGGKICRGKITKWQRRGLSKIPGSKEEVVTIATLGMGENRKKHLDFLSLLTEFQAVTSFSLVKGFHLPQDVEVPGMRLHNVWVDICSSAYSTPLPRFLATETSLSFGELPQPHLWSPCLPTRGGGKQSSSSTGLFWGGEKGSHAFSDPKWWEPGKPFCHHAAKPTENNTNRRKTDQRDENSGRNNDDTWDSQ